MILPHEAGGVQATAAVAHRLPMGYSPWITVGLSLPIDVREPLLPAGLEEKDPRRH